MLLLLLIIALPVIGWYVGTSLFDILTGSKPEKQTKDTYIIHNHYDNRQVHLHQSNQPEENHLQD